MISKSQIKLITSLHRKKGRREEMLFIAEGEKVVRDAMDSGFVIQNIYSTQAFIEANGNFNSQLSCEIISDEEINKISALTNPPNVLAVIEIPAQKNKINYQKGRKLVLDQISDPGNLGTIIRIADWFGIDELICSENTVDCFNPKVVQASMGSVFRVKIFYKDLHEVFDSNVAENKLKVFATRLDGKSIYDVKLPADCFLLIGNESTGISDSLFHYFTDKITIPNYSKGHIDSLNVAVATGIICAEWMR